MKRLLLFTFFSCFSIILHAQFITENTAIGVSVSGLGDNTTFHLTNISGAGGYSNRGYYSFGITYIRPISNKFDIETGIEYSKYRYHFTNSSLGPDIDVSRNVDLSLLEIPITVRFNFWKYFFLNGGLLLDFDITNDKHLDNQTGIGTILGFGAKYDFKKAPIGLFLNPYIKYRPLIPFTKESYHLRTMEVGFRFGVLYNF
ncbi:MAG: outer membrane beta-barrel protein [Bacteroidales bacterium]